MNKEYLIDNLIQNDPFQLISKKTRNVIIFEYLSYRNYLIYLEIIGRRLKDNYEKYGELEPHIIQYMENLETVKNYDVQILIKNQHDIMKEIQLDQESFIIFSKILLDKFGIFVGKLIDAKDYPNSFSDHKKWFIKNNYLNPRYSKILTEMHWYDQFLLVMRDKIIEHGGKTAFTTMFSITRNGVLHYRRKRGDRLGFLSEKQKGYIETLIIKYGRKNENIKNIPLNPAMMLDQFLELILEQNIKLDESDLKELGSIVQSVGGTIDAIILAKHLRKFLDDTAQIFDIYDED